MMKKKNYFREYKRGQVVYVDFGFQPNGVQGFIRPAVVVSCDASKTFCEEESRFDELVEISNYNSSTQSVISGNLEAIKRVAARYEGSSIVTKMLNVSAPFHSRAMKMAAEKLVEVLKKYSYGEIAIPVLSNYTGRPYSDKNEIITNLEKQLYHPVQWLKIMDYINTHQISAVIEMGPKMVLKKFAEKDMDKVKAFAFDEETERKQLKEYMQWKPGEPTLVTRCMAVAVATPNKNWDNDAYEKGVSIPYREIEKIQDELDRTKEFPSEEVMNKALEMLKSVFKTKLLSKEEQSFRFKQILNETGMQNKFCNYLE